MGSEPGTPSLNDKRKMVAFALKYISLYPNCLPTATTRRRAPAEPGIKPST